MKDWNTLIPEYSKLWGDKNQYDLTLNHEHEVHDFEDAVSGANLEAANEALEALKESINEKGYE